MSVDQDYACAPHIPDGERYPALWVERAQAFREKHPPETHRYGPAPRAELDLFRPDGAARGLVVFVHGGFWRSFARTDWSQLAGGALARGWAVAMPSYTLAPDARISEITQQVARALELAAGLVDGPIVLTGHSAGGHLSARMACRDVTLDAAVAGRVRRILPISPLGDLRPFVGSGMNEVFRLDPAEAEAESPALCTDRRDIPVSVWVGGAERPAFIAQAEALSNAWAAPLTIVPELHHFDIIEALSDPDSAMVADLLDLS